MLQNNIESIYNKYKKTKKFYILELLLNLYLIECSFRNLFQIFIPNDNIEKKIIEINKILNQTKYTSINFDERIIIYDNSKFDINKLDKTFGKIYGNQLGVFYFAAIDNFKLFKDTYKYRIVIEVRSSYTYAELYAQMTTKSLLVKNMNKIIKIYDEIKKILLNCAKFNPHFDIKKFNTDFEIFMEKLKPN